MKCINAEPIVVDITRFGVNEVLRRFRAITTFSYHCAVLTFNDDNLVYFFELNIDHNRELQDPVRIGNRFLSWRSRNRPNLVYFQLIDTESVVICNSGICRFRVFLRLARPHGSGPRAVTCKIGISV